MISSLFVFEPYLVLVFLVVMSQFFSHALNSYDRCKSVFQVMLNSHLMGFLGFVVLLFSSNFYVFWVGSFFLACSSVLEFYFRKKNLGPKELALLSWLSLSDVLIYVGLLGVFTAGEAMNFSSMQSLQKSELLFGKSFIALIALGIYMKLGLASWPLYFSEKTSPSKLSILTWSGLSGILLTLKLSPLISFQSGLILIVSCSLFVLSLFLICEKSHSKKRVGLSVLHVGGGFLCVLLEHAELGMFLVLSGFTVINIFDRFLNLKFENKERRLSRLIGVLGHLLLMLVYLLVAAVTFAQLKSVEVFFWALIFCPIFYIYSKSIYSSVSQPDLKERFTLPGFEQINLLISSTLIVFLILTFIMPKDINFVSMDFFKELKISFLPISIEAMLGLSAMVFVGLFLASPFFFSRIYLNSRLKKIICQVSEPLICVKDFCEKRIGLVFYKAAHEVGRSVHHSIECVGLNLIAVLAYSSEAAVRATNERLQNGQIQSYLFYFVLGLVAIVVFVFI